MAAGGAAAGAAATRTVVVDVSATGVFCVLLRPYPSRLITFLISSFYFGTATTHRTITPEEDVAETGAVVDASIDVPSS